MQAIKWILRIHYLLNNMKANVNFFLLAYVLTNQLNLKKMWNVDEPKFR